MIALLLEVAGAVFLAAHEMDEPQCRRGLLAVLRQHDLHLRGDAVQLRQVYGSGTQLRPLLGHRVPDHADVDRAELHRIGDRVHAFEVGWLGRSTLSHRPRSVSRRRVSLPIAVDWLPRPSEWSAATKSLQLCKRLL